MKPIDILIILMSMIKLQNNLSLVVLLASFCVEFKHAQSLSSKFKLKLPYVEVFDHYLSI